MANVFTGTAAIANQTGPYNLIQAAYDKMVEFQLRSEPLFRAFADKRPVSVDKPGSSIILQKFNDLAVQTTALTENVDPDSVAISDTTPVTITLNEYGAAVLSTEKLALESLSAIDPAIANIVAYNMLASLDVLCQTVLRAGTNVVREQATALTSVGGTTIGTGATASIAATDTIKSRDIRFAVSKLRATAAVPGDGGFYTGLIHPDVSLDLRTESAAAGWRTPHEYSGVSAIFNGEIGVYEGVKWIETPRAYQATDGAASAKVSRTYILGKQALAEAVANEPKIVIGNVTDKLMRTRPIGWKALLGWAIYRNEALMRIETSSSY